MYPVKKFRIFLAIFVSVPFACLLILFSAFLWNYNLRVFQKDFLEKSRTKAVLLKNLAIEKPNAEYRVLISQAISQIVEESRKESKNMRIREAFFLNRKGNVIAHSNPMHMSKEMKSEYKDAKYKRILFQPKGDPTLARPLKYRETVLAFMMRSWQEHYPSLVSFLERFFQEKIISEYSIEVACYFPNFPEPLSSLHLITELTVPDSFLNPWHYYQVHNVYLIIFLSLLILCFLFVGHYYNPLYSNSYRLSKRGYQQTAMPYGLHQFPSSGHAVGIPASPFLPPQPGPYPSSVYYHPDPSQYFQQTPPVPTRAEAIPLD